MKALIWAMLVGVLALCFVGLLIIVRATVQTLYTLRDLRSAALDALSTDEYDAEPPAGLSTRPQRRLPP